MTGSVVILLGMTEHDDVSFDEGFLVSRGHDVQACSALLFIVDCWRSQ